MEHLIELKNVNKTYKNGSEKTKVLSDINLQIDKGELVAIVGQSGSGKSTLMNILGCLDTPQEGQYFLEGRNVANMRERELSYIRNREIGFIFQSFNLIPTLTALENVELPLFYRGIKKRERRNLAYDALCCVGLEKRITHRPSQLSGGQQQRVAIARAIAASPPIILADEPTGNLDKASGEDVIKILFDLHRNGKTVILITHDVKLASKSPRNICIIDGKIK
ncbi:MAG: ABC transporter ATP-binding protein [Acutalibacteraceae bacterium]